MRFGRDQKNPALPLLKSLRSALKPGDEDVVKKFISTFLYTFLDGRVIAVLCTVLEACSWNTTNEIR